MGEFMHQYNKSHTKKVRSGSGGKRAKLYDKKRAHIGGAFTATKISDKDERITIRVRGGSTKQRLKRAAYINVVTKEGKIVKTRILRVLESPNPEYVRGNIITRGAVLETEIGKARVTNNVGQDGVVNGVQL